MSADPIYYEDGDLGSSDDDRIRNNKAKIVRIKIADVAENILKKYSENIEIINKSINLILKILIIYFLVFQLLIPIDRVLNEENNGIIIHPFDTNGITHIDGDYLHNILFSELNAINNGRNTGINASRTRFITNDSSSISLNPIYSTMHIQNETFGQYEMSWENHDTPAMPPIAVSSGAYSSMLSQMGELNFQGTAIPLGNLALLSKQIKAGCDLNCSIERLGSSLEMIAVLDNRTSRKYLIFRVNRIINESNQSIDEMLPSMTRDLAFQIAYEEMKRYSSPKEKIPQSWQSLKDIYEGTDAYHKYLLTNNSTFLDVAAKRAIKVKNNEPSLPWSYDLLYICSMEYAKLENYTTMETILRELNQSSMVPILLAEGIAKYNQGDYDTALNNFEKALLLKGDLYEAWYNKGLCLMAKKEIQDAIDSFDNASDVEKLSKEYKSRALVMKGKAYLALESKLNPNKYYYALNSFENAINNSSSSEAYIGKGEAAYLIGKMESDNNSKKRYKDAEEAFAKALNGDPTNAYLHYERANALFAQGNYSAALIEYNNATIWDPNLAAAYNGKGNALSALGNYEAAVKAFNESIKKCNNNTLLVYRMNYDAANKLRKINE